MVLAISLVRTPFFLDIASKTSFAESFFLDIPAAKVVTTAIDAYFNPASAARIVSGALVIPTRSAPSILNALISAGVSNLGPAVQT